MDLFSERTILTVTRLTDLIKGVLEDNFEHLWVEGEVSGLSQPASGHLYFSLKDSGAMIRCVMFRSSAKSLKFKLEDGMVLILKGRLSVYDQRGEYQVLAEYLEPRGVGALQLAFLQTKERLAGEGMFDQGHKKTLPALPQRVGVVTSATGAAIHDILNVLGRRFAALDVVVVPVRVQGEGSAAEIAQAIQDINYLKAADVLIVGRGGGSPEDLWAFNEEVVARAIYASNIPIISAVGHETDWTIADFVADVRSPTPSAAAELVCTSSEELCQKVDNLGHRLLRAQKSTITLLQRTIEGLQRSLHDPSMLLGHLGQRMDDLTERLDHSVRNGLAKNRQQLLQYEQTLSSHHPATSISRLRQQLLQLTEHADFRVTLMLDRLGRTHGQAAACLDTLSPLLTLARGYAVAESIDGRVIRTGQALQSGDRLRLRLHQGSVMCKVEQTSL